MPLPVPWAGGGCEVLEPVYGLYGPVYLRPLRRRSGCGSGGVPGGWPSIGAQLGCAGNDQLLCILGARLEELLLIAMDGRGVFRFAVETVPRCVEQVLQQRGCTVADVDALCSTRPTPVSQTWPPESLVFRRRNTIKTLNIMEIPPLPAFPWP